MKNRHPPSSQQGSSHENAISSRENNCDQPSIRILNEPNRRELAVWLFAFFQFVVLMIKSANTTNEYDTVAIHNIGRKLDNHNNLDGALAVNEKMINHQNETIRRRQVELTQNHLQYFEGPIVYPKDAGLVSRVWHSNGAPYIHPGFTQGSCWCSADKWCTCTPSLAIDLILRSGPEHLWVVKRKDTDQFALMVS